MATTGRFCPISLGDWLQVCSAARVPAVPAKQITEIRREDYQNWTDEGPGRERLIDAYGKMREVAAKAQMVRYDCCSSSELKYAMAHGKPEWSEDFGTLIVDDPRVYTVIEGYPRELVPVWQRPWIKTQIHEGYPAEYRVFVRDGKVVGISSYYPQRPLPFEPGHLSTVLAYAEQLSVELTGVAFEWHSGMAFLMGRDRIGLDGVHFSADFIVSDTGEILFLEGGPPHELGAHECCFDEGDVEGIALADGQYYSRLGPAALGGPLVAGMRAQQMDLDENELRYAGTFSEPLYNDQELAFHRDESYEDVMRADCEI